MSEQLSFSNMDVWRGGSGKFGLTFKQIVLQHINRCIVNGSVEWLGGRWEDVGHNPTTRRYVPNTRETYCNSVKMLRACLLGYYDEKIEESDKELHAEFEEKYSEYKENKVSKTLWFTYKVEWHLRLFEELIKLSKRLNFFEEQSAEEDL